MATIAELRAAYPDFLKDKSDTDIVRMLAEKDGLSLPYVAYELGLDPAEWQQNEGTMDDLGTSVELGWEQTKRGIANLPNVVSGLVTGENLYETPEMDNTIQRLQTTFSPGYQEAQREIGSAWDEGRYGDYALGLLTNPGYTGNQLAQALPTMAGGGLIGAGARGMAALGALGRGALARGTAVAAPYIGEGAVSAGIGYKNLLDEDVDPRTAALAGVAQGVGVGAAAGLGGYLAGKAGYVDPERIFAGMTRRVGDETVPLSYKGQIGYGMLAEGAEEAVQSPWEEAVSNVAQDKPWDEGLGRSAIEGFLAGGLIGGGVNALTPPLRRKIDSNTQTDLLQDDQLDPTKGLDTSRVNAPSVGAGIRNLAGLNTAEGLSNWAGVQGPSDTAGYTSDLTASYNEPSGHRVADKVTGVERELSMGDWLYYQATGQLPPTADPVKVEGKPKPVEGVTPETQRLLDVAKNLPMAADPAKVRPGEVSANGHRASGRPTKDAVNWATTLSGLKTEDEVNKAVEKGTRSKAGYWQWVMPMAAARIQEIKAEQAKQSAANTGRPNPDTSTEADAKTRVNPTTSSVVAPDGVNAVPEGGPAPVVQDEVPPSGATIPSGVSPSGATIPSSLPPTAPEKQTDAEIIDRENDAPINTFLGVPLVNGDLAAEEGVAAEGPLREVNARLQDAVSTGLLTEESYSILVERARTVYEEDGPKPAYDMLLAAADGLSALPSPTTPETPTNALSGQTTPQAGQETGTTPPAPPAPGVAEAPSAPLVTPTGRKRRETPPPPKAQGKSAVAPGMGKTTTAPTSAEAPSMEFLTDRDAVSAKVREQYGNIVSSLPILSKPKNQIRLRSEEDRGPVTELMTNAFIDYMDTLVESRGVGESDQGLRTIATEISDSINQSGSLVRKDGQPTTVSHTWVGNQLKLLASKAKTDPTLAALSARAQALRVMEEEAIRAEKGLPDEAEEVDPLAQGDGTEARVVAEGSDVANPARLSDVQVIKYAPDPAEKGKKKPPVDPGMNLNELTEDDTELGTEDAIQAALRIGGTGASVDETGVLGSTHVAAWARATGQSKAAAKQELNALPVEIRDEIKVAVRAGRDVVVPMGEKAAPIMATGMSGDALDNYLRGVRARYQNEAAAAEQSEPAKRDVYTPPKTETSTFGAKYELHRSQNQAPIRPFAELEGVMKPATLRMYEGMWDKADTPQKQADLAARINKAYETTIAKRAERGQPAAAQSQPVAADGAVNLDRGNPAVVGEERPGEGAGVPGPDRGPGVGGVRRAGDTGQGQGAGRAVAERGQPAGGIDIPAPERLVANKLAKGASPRKVTRPMARIWQEAANQDPISDVSNMSEGTAQQELEEVNAVLATQGVDGVAAWMNPVNRAMGITKLRRELLDKAKQAAQAEPQVQQGLGEDVAATNPTTEQTLRDTIASLLGKGHNWRIHVYATPEEAHAAGHTPRKVGNAYGWVEADQKGVKHAYFIVNRIEQGTELGKFLHEVGAHIGLENILSEKEYAFLHDKILDWFVAGEAGDISIEAQAALSAAKRVKQAKKDRERAGGTYPRAEEMSELIAYFVEEAVNAYGVNPTAGKISGRLAEWFRKLITAFKRALGKLNIDNLDALTPQDVVDLAYGAARLSLVERKNAAPQRVTEAMPTQYGVDIPSHASAISEAVQNQLSKGGTGVKSNLLGWLRLDQLAEQYGKQLPMVAELNKLFNQMSAKAKHWLNRADHVIRMWDMLTPKQKELMHWIMGNATVEGYDPDDSQTTARNDQQRLLDQKWKQLQALDAANPKMKAATVYRAARKHYQDDMQEAIDYLNGLKTQAKGANDKQLDSMITTLKALTKKSKGVYFPLMRFGDFYTVGMSSQLHALHQKRKALLDKGQALDEAEEKLYQKLRKDEKHYQVTGHDSERQARKHADKLRAQGMQATSNVGRYSQDAVRNTLSKDMDSFNKLLAELEVPKGVASRLQTAYESLLIDALPEGHTLKRQMDRDGIAGWDTDMRRVFAKSTQSRAFALSRLINMRQVQEQMAQLKRAGESFEPNAQLASPLYNELMARQELAYTRSEDPWWTRTATTWNYLTMLSFSPAFWLLNLSQVPVVTLPWLAARNDNQYGATMTGLAKAAGQTAKLIKWSIEGNEWRAELDTTRAIPGISQDEKQLLLDMQDAGKLEFTIGQDIGAVAEGKSDFWAKLTRSINTPTHATELINRASTALTAYRISRKNGNDHAKAVEFAIRASDTTHVNYDPVVGARNMQTVFGSAPLAKIVFQFWKFQQGMAYLALSTMKDAWNHPDPAIKKQARDTAIGMTLTLTSTAGAFGLPFVGSALGLLTLAFGLDGDDDEDDDAGRMLKNWMHDYLPGPVEDYLTKGIWGWFDGPDPSARFSMGGLMNPLAFARFDDTERGEDTLKEIMFRVFGGATGASAAAIWDGLSAVGDGDYTKAGEKLLPLKFLRDLAKTVTLNTEGLATGKGEQRLDPNDFSVVDSIWQAMGIQPAKKTNYYDRQGAIQAQKQVVEGTRDKLLAEYGQARLQGKDVSSIVVKITRFNQRNPHARIKAENLRQAVDRRKTNRRETDATGMLVNKSTRPYLANARWTE